MKPDLNHVHYIELGRMAAEVFHDLRNPLATISLALEELNTEIPHNRFRRPTRLALKNIQTIVRFIEAHQRHIQSSVEPHVFSPLAELTLAVHALEFKFRKRRVRLQITQKARVQLFGKPIAFYRIAMNLLSNAIDAYLEYPTDQDIVEVYLEKTPAHLVLAVRDWGSGIDRQDLIHISDPLFTTKPLSQGTGLGLTTAKSLIEQEFNGTLLCCSQAHQGSTFRVYLPLAD